MQKDDETSYVPRQLKVAIRLAGQQAITTCTTSAIAQDALLISGCPYFPAGCELALTLELKSGETVSFDCMSEGLVGQDQRLRYHRLGFEQRVRLEELIRPHWDGIDLLEGLMTLSGLYGATTLKECLYITGLLERIQPRLLHLPSSAV